MMPIVLFMCLFSFSCLVLSSLAVIYIIFTTKGKGDEIETNSDELIVITGCDSGIGLELAKYIFASTNYKILCGLLNYENENFQLKALDSERVTCKQLDIKSNGDVDQFKMFIEYLIKQKKVKKVAAVINNAGVMAYGEFDWLTWNQIQDQIDVNFLGTIRFTKSILPLIIESKGRIINISSVNDTTVFPGLSIYSATKSALSTFSRGLGYELRKFGVHVTTIRLGDFARLTSIMNNHAQNRDAMYSEMDARKKSLYGDYFNQFHEHLLKNYGMTCPNRFGDSNLFKDIEEALLSKYPPNTITCAPLGFRLFYAIVEISPVWFQYCLLDLLLQFGFKWKPTTNNVKTRLNCSLHEGRV